VASTNLNSSPGIIGRVRTRLPAFAGYAVPFALVLYLALVSGGYELITRSQVGIVVWWAILLGAAFGLFPVIRVTRSGWTVLAIMGVLTLWTALGALTWTQSTERSVIEVSRSVTLLGFLLVLLLVQGRDGLRRSVGAAGAAIATVAVVALASRYHPAWFDIGELPVGYPIARLNYPVGYWNGLGTLMAIGIPVLLWVASRGKTIAGRSLAAAFLPLLVLVTYLTASRGGLIEVAAAILALVILTPGRPALLARAIFPGIFSLVLLILINKRPELRDNLGGVANQQGTQMIWLTSLVVIAGAGLAWLLESRILPRIEWPSASRSTMSVVGLGLSALVLSGLIVGLASGSIAERWDQFKEPVTESATVDRLSSVSSGERYQYWQTAADAGESSPVTGLGPGTFEYWWARNGTGPSYVRDAHNLYLEGFGEMGIPGLLLTLGLVLVPIGLAVRRATRDADDERRPAFAAAAAGMIAFAVAAGIDWAWELTVLPALFFVLVAAVCGPDGETRRGRMNAPDFHLPLLPAVRVGIAAVALIGIFVIWVPMSGNQKLLKSQELYREGDFAGSLVKAKDALDRMPWSATTNIQIALLHNEAGNGRAALKAARNAADDDPYNWQAWYVLGSIAKTVDDKKLSKAAYKQVDEMNRNFQPAN